MRWGTGTVLRLLGTGLLLWLGGTFLLPLCFPFLLGTALALGAEPLVKLMGEKLRLPRGISAGLGVLAVFLGLTVLLL